jgi:hypothetical protein
MDDYEMDGIGSDNPALTVPAAQRAPINRIRSHGRQQASPNSSGSSQKIVTATELTKYDVSQHEFNLR